MTRTNTLPDAQELKKMMDVMRMGWWKADFKKETYTCSDLIVEFLQLDSDQMSFGDFLQMVRPDYRALVSEQFSKIHFTDTYEQIFPIVVEGESLWMHSKLVDKTDDLIVTGTIQQLIKAGEKPKELIAKQIDDLIDQQNSIYNSLLTFLGAEEITSAIDSVFRDILRRFHGSRVSLFEYSPDGKTQSCIYEVTDPSASRALPYSQNFDTSQVPWWTARMQSGMNVITNTLDDLPEEARAEKEFLSKQQVHSLLAAPLISRDRVWGFFGLDTADQRQWSSEEYQLFASTANLLSICMQFHASETRIRQNQKNIGDLYKYMPTGYVRMKLFRDGEGNLQDYIYLDANDAASRMLGFPFQEAKGRKASEMGRALHLKSKEVLDIINTDQHLTRNFFSEELGKHFQTVIFSPAREEIAALLTDVTETVNTRKILEENEEKLRNIYRNLPVGIELYDKNGVLVDLNEKELEIFGLRNEEEALGLNVFENPNIPDDIKEKLRRRERVEFTLNYDFEQVGEYYSSLREKVINLVTIATPLFDKEGVFSNYLFINIDNTDVVQSHRQIEAFEQMTSLIGEFAQVGYAQFDAYTRDGTAIDSWFANFAEKPGTPLTEIVGVMNNVNPEDKPPIREFFRKIKLGEARHLRHDVRVNQPDGSQKWTRINVMVREENPQEGKLGMVCVNYDITALKETEERLIAARDEAQASDRLKSAFLANMSHEIRTPLNAIVGFSNLLVESETPEEQQEYLSIVQENNELLLQLISDILDFSKIEAGFLEFNPEPVDVYLLCAEVIQAFSIKTPKGVQLLFDTSSPRVSIEGDRKRIAQVIFNFLTNAMKFTQAGSITLSYRIEGQNELRFQVSDTGIGISEEQQAAIFTRFVKLNSFAKGTGLGLTICQSLVTQMGGSIGVESIEGEGSTFWFTHPFDADFSSEALKSAEALPEEPRPAKPSAKEHHSTEKPLILVAEDIDSNYLLLNTLLQKEYRLVRAVNGLEAVEFFNREQPELVLMDMKMPEMDGLEATEIIRRENTQVPIIALTAFAFDSDREKVIAAGCNDFLTKPIVPGQLRETLRKWLC